MGDVNAAQSSVERVSENDDKVVLLHLFETTPELLSSGDRFRPRDDWAGEANNWAAPY